MMEKHKLAFFDGDKLYTRPVHLTEDEANAVGSTRGIMGLVHVFRAMATSEDYGGEPTRMLLEAVAFNGQPMFEIPLVRAVVKFAEAERQGSEGLKADTE